jgi:uncharacterized protein (TIGR01777 family)
MPTVLITGGTGTIGKRLSELLVQKGYDVIILTRHVSKENNGSSKMGYARWNIARGEIDKNAIAAGDYIVNLAGAGVAEKRWTDDRKRVILESRTQTAELLVKALREIPNKVKAVVSASAAGYYGADDPETLREGFTEEHKPSADFLGQVCKQWEASITPVKELGKRLVFLRTGIVLSPESGAFTEFVKPLRFGVAPILGSGRQIVSWIHEDDICNMYLYAIEQESMSGAYNAAAPYPIPHRELMLTIAKTKRKIYIPLPVPAFALKLALGEMATEVLKSTRLNVGKISKEGYSFIYPKIQEAVASLL